MSKKKQIWFCINTSLPNIIRVPVLEFTPSTVVVELKVYGINSTVKSIYEEKLRRTSSTAYYPTLKEAVVNKRLWLKEDIRLAEVSLSLKHGRLGDFETWYNENHINHTDLK